MKLIIAKTHFLLLDFEESGVKEVTPSMVSLSVGCTEGEAVYALKRLVDTKVVDEYVSVRSMISAHVCWNGLRQDFTKLNLEDECQECGEVLNDGFISSYFSLKVRNKCRGL